MEKFCNAIYTSNREVEARGNSDYLYNNIKCYHFTHFIFILQYFPSWLKQIKQMCFIHNVMLS